MYSFGGRKGKAGGGLWRLSGGLSIYLVLWRREGGDKVKVGISERTCPIPTTRTKSCIIYLVLGRTTKSRFHIRGSGAGRQICTTLSAFESLLFTPVSGWRWLPPLVYTSIFCICLGYIRCHILTFVLVGASTTHSPTVTSLISF